MLKPRTSLSHPLQIAELKVGPSYGRIGITFCPGKQDMFAASGAWQRDLALDVQAISEWGANLVLSLIESEEMASLKVTHLGDVITQQGMLWMHLPIADFSIPSPSFEKGWLVHGKAIRQHLIQGENVLIHCKGGLGRAGMMAARLLVELGLEPEQAIKKVRQVRKGAIETPLQLALVRQTKVMLNE